jgi:hypothetical protein
MPCVESRLAFIRGESRTQVARGPTILQGSLNPAITMPSHHRRPDFEAFHRSIAAELSAIKDRLRNLVVHWPTDGAWKEAALRTVLRRHLPEVVVVGTGFIVTAEESSSQIDLMLVDASKPILFRDGDLMVVTPDAVLGIIEVKTAIDSGPEMTAVLAKLSAVKAMCHGYADIRRIWAGLFVFEERTPAQDVRVLSSLYDAAETHHIAIDAVSVGQSTFVRFWERGSVVDSPCDSEVWHSYELPDMAPSYFVGNLVDSISGVDRSSAFAWFPVLGGKEQNITHYQAARVREMRSFAVDERPAPDRPI